VPDRPVCEVDEPCGQVCRHTLSSILAAPSAEMTNGNRVRPLTCLTGRFAHLREVDVFLLV
jgi:hypothetical protein